MSLFYGVVTLEPAKTTQTKSQAEKVVTEEPLEDRESPLTPNSDLDSDTAKERARRLG